MRTACTLACAILALASFGARADSSSTVCDIEVESNLKNFFYLVTVNGKPFKDKRYIDYSDAVQLRDVLVQIGMCWRAKTVRKCEVRPLDGGTFTVARAGATFDPRMIFKTRDNAHARAKQLAAAHLCYIE